jgi:hypothetical protein
VRKGGLYVGRATPKGLLVHWYCTKQNSVSLTLESEFIAAAHGVQELLGCHELLQEIGSNTAQPIPLYMDNHPAIAQITQKHQVSA